MRELVSARLRGSAFVPMVGAAEAHQPGELRQQLGRRAERVRRRGRLRNTPERMGVGARQAGTTVGFAPSAIASPGGSGL